VVRTAAVAGFALFYGTFLPAQAPVPVSDEPHHTRVMYASHLRMFEIVVPPGTTTLDHAHDRDVAVVALGDTTIRTRTVGRDWDAPRSYVPGGINLVTYTGAPAAHAMENIGKTPYRVFAVENMRENGWTTPRIIEAQATALLQESRAFSVYEVRLSTSIPQTSHVHQQPTVVILLSGSIGVQGGGGESEFRIDAPGRWFASSPDQPHTLSLIGASDARLIEVEAR
jgi:quercetin dioxygenase-like cupin family protein